MMLVPMTAYAVTAEEAAICPDGSGSATLRDHIYSTYTIQIPETIDISSENDSFSVALANDNIEAGCSVYVWVTNLDSNNQIQLTHTGDDSFTEMASITSSYLGVENTVSNENPLAIFNHNEESEYSYVNATVNIQERAFKSGFYEGTMNYCYSCVYP